MNNLERSYEKFLEVLEKFFEHQVLPMQRRRIFIAQLWILCFSKKAFLWLQVTQCHFFKRSGAEF